MMNFLNIFYQFLALVLASFIFWHRLKEDYQGEPIFTLSVLILTAGYFGKRFWGIQAGVLGAAMVLILYSNKAKLNPWLVADAAVLPILIIGLAYNLAGLLFEYALWRLVVVLILVFNLFLSLKLQKSYRSISWYKSGKVGFLACIACVAFFSPFLVLEFILKKALYWQLSLNLVLVLSSSVLLYKRSERKLREDFKKVTSIFKKNGKISISS